MSSTFRAYNPPRYFALTVAALDEAIQDRPYASERMNMDG